MQHATLLLKTFSVVYASAAACSSANCCCCEVCSFGISSAVHGAALLFSHITLYTARCTTPSRSDLAAGAGETDRFREL